MTDLAKQLALSEKAALNAIPEVECKGVYFRGKVNQFVTDTRVARHVEVTLLKRKSCPGCSKCGHFLDDVRESLGWGELHLDNIEHGKLYRAKTVVDSVDWEGGGYADGWHTEFQEAGE